MNATTTNRIETRLSPEEEEPGAKRRRLRRGTHSCWECKRRKVKCIFKSESDPSCSPCLRRGLTCVSQEFPEEASQEEGRQLGDRLGRIEVLLGQLVKELQGRPG